MEKKFFNHLYYYPTAGNLSYTWGLGSSLGLFLGLQIVTGLLLTSHYIADASTAFMSVEHVMRDVSWGWLLRYGHANGATFIFILMYGHISRGLYHQSFRSPRAAVWYSGVTLFILMAGSAFLGYVLPWGQMSLWAATVITNIISVIPVIGGHIVTWIWGGYAVGYITLIRFYTLHFLLPFVVAGLAVVHIYLLHESGSTNPKGANGTSSTYTHFSPYYVWKDIAGFLFWFFWFIVIVCFFPNMFGHPDNYIPADPMVTPAHIVPEWYFLPFYAILKGIPDKLGGAVAMGLSMALLYALPALSRDQLRISAFVSVYHYAVLVFVLDVLLLGWLGGQAPIQIYTQLSLYVLTPIYFAFFGFVFAWTYLHKLVDGWNKSKKAS
jgi:quinol-cytochrome oxidoreductase complex cytochrome b subunit